MSADGVEVLSGQTKNSMEYWLNRYEKFKNDRDNWRTRWNETAEFCWPAYIDSQESKSAKKSSGDDNTDRWRLSDSTAIVSRRHLANFIHGSVTPPGQPWVDFKPLSEKDSHAVKEFFRLFRKKIQFWFNASNFDREVNLFYNILCGFGSPGQLFEDVFSVSGGKTLFHFESIFPDELYPTFSQDGSLTEMMRNFSMGASDIITRWPALQDRAETIAAAASDNPNKKFEILHVVYPREGKEFKFASDYIFIEDEANLKAAVKENGLGYRTFPYLYQQWEKGRSEVYSSCPAYDALSDIRSINELKNQILEATERLLNPASMQTENALVNPSDGINIGAKGTNIVTSMDEIKFLNENARYDVAKDLYETFRLQIEKNFFIDQITLPPMEKTPHTATEVQAQLEFRLMVLGPMFGSFKHDFLNQLMRRAADIVWKYQAYAGIDEAKIPPVIFDNMDPDGPLPFELVYTGPLSRAQDQRLVANMERIVFQNAELAATMGEVNPELYFLINRVEYQRKSADAYGVGADFMNSPEFVKTNADAYREQQQQQRETALLQQGTQAAKNVGITANA